MFNIASLELIKSLWEATKLFWYFWVIAVGIIGIRIFFNWFEVWLEKRRTKRWLEEHKKLEDWKEISGIEFSKVTAAIYRNLGYKTIVTDGPGDEEIDIKGLKDGKRILFQCKNMEKAEPHDIRAFSDTLRKQDFKEGDMGVFVTTGRFTKEGRRMAKEAAASMELVNGIELEKLAKKSDSN